MTDPLYQIADDIQRLLEMDDIDDETRSATMEGLDYSMEQKVASCGLYLEGLRAEAQMVEAEAERLDNRVVALNRKAHHLRAYMLFQMRRVNLDKVKTPLITVSVQQGRMGIVIDDAAAIPDEFVKIERKVMRTEIARQLESGNPIPGAHMARGESFLTIR